MPTDPLSFATREELDAIAAEVVKPLHGLPLCDALSVLDRHARALVLSGHRVDLTNPRYRQLEAAVAAAVADRRRSASAAA